MKDNVSPFWVVGKGRLGEEKGGREEERETEEDGMGEGKGIQEQLATVTEKEIWKRVTYPRLLFLFQLSCNFVVVAFYNIFK